MFFAWGSHSVRQPISRGQGHCEQCNQDREFVTVASYKVSHLWYLFRWISEKSFRAICTGCDKANIVNASDVEAEFRAQKKSPYPFMDRFGWAVGLGLVAVLAAGATVSAMVGKTSDLAMLEHPQIGDVYAVDLARMMEEPEASVMYSAMKVSAVTADSVELMVPKRYANKASMIGTDISMGRANSDDYYTDERTSFTLEDLRYLRETGAMQQAHRPRRIGN